MASEFYEARVVNGYGQMGAFMIRESFDFTGETGTVYTNQAIFDEPMPLGAVSMNYDGNGLAGAVGTSRWRLEYREQPWRDDWINMPKFYQFNLGAAQDLTSDGDFLNGSEENAPLSNDGGRHFFLVNNPSSVNALVQCVYGVRIRFTLAAAVTGTLNCDLTILQSTR